MVRLEYHQVSGLYYDQGMTLKEVAEATGACNEQWVQKFMKKHDFPRRRVGVVKHNRRKDYREAVSHDEVVRLYTEEKKTLREIGKIYGVDATWLSSILRDKGIEIRTYPLPTRDESTLLDTDIRRRKWYHLRQRVLKRDKHRCQLCNFHGKGRKGLRAHHIKTRAKHPKEAWEENNLVTLCIECHWFVHHSGWGSFLGLLEE